MFFLSINSYKAIVKDSQKGCNLLGYSRLDVFVYIKKFRFQIKFMVKKRTISLWLFTFVVGKEMVNEPAKTIYVLTCSVLKI